LIIAVTNQSVITMPNYQYDKWYVLNYFTDGKITKAAQVVSVLEKHGADDYEF
jgi:hypothetical protein